MSKKVIFDPATVCEDIRLEADGRVSLMGVIAAGISSKLQGEDKFFRQRLAFYIPGRARGKVEFEIEFLDPNGEVLEGAQVKMDPVKELSEYQPFFVPFHSQVYEIKYAGAYCLRVMVLGDDQWENIAFLDVSLLK